MKITYFKLLTISYTLYLLGMFSVNDDGDDDDDDDETQQEGHDDGGSC